MDSEKPLASARTVHSITTLSTPRKGTLFTRNCLGTYTPQTQHSPSKESSRSSRRKFRKQSTTNFQNFFVKTSSAVREQQQTHGNLQSSGATEQTLSRVESPPKGTYKRSTTPYRTSSELRELQKTRVNNSGSTTNVTLNRNIQQVLDKDVLIAQLESQLSSLQTQLRNVWRDNQQLHKMNANLQSSNRELEECNRQLNSELDNRQPKTETDTMDQPPNRSKMLLKLKKNIYDSRRAELQQDKNQLFRQFRDLREANRQLKQYISEIERELDFKRTIIRNYECAASLPSAKEAFLSQQIVALKEQLNALNNHFDSRLQHETHDLREKNILMKKQMEKMAVRLHCAQRLHEQQKQAHTNLTRIELANTRNRLNRFIRDYQHFQKEYVEAIRENAALKLKESLSSNRLDSQTSLTYSLD